MLILFCLLLCSSMTNCALCARLQMLIAFELRAGVKRRQLSGVLSAVKDGMENIF